MHVRLLLLLIIIGAALVIPAPGTASAQGSQRCFAETGFCIDGPIRAYWEHNGGLPVLGYSRDTCKNGK